MGVSASAVTALLIACGCPDALLDDAYSALRSKAVPDTHREIAKQVRETIANLLNEATR